MTNKRLLPGKNLSAHPLADEEPHKIYVRGAPFLAVRAEQGGSIDTPNGVKTFHAGDWICTDYPPTYAWVVDAQGFAAAGYTIIGTIGDGTSIVFPIAEADNEIEHSDYTGVATPEDTSVGQDVMVVSIANEASAPDPEVIAGGSTDMAATQAVATMEAVATMAAADPISTPAPSATEVPLPPVISEKAGLPAGVPVSPPKGRARPKK